MGRLLQQGIGRVSSVRVLLDGLQEERVAGDPLHRHHQEETQRGGVDFRPSEDAQTAQTVNAQLMICCVVASRAQKMVSLAKHLILMN